MKLAPIVTAQAELSQEEMMRYSRHILLPEFGIDGQRRLKASRVLVIGAGGLGSPSLLYLAAAGVGTLGIVDFDTVDLSNLQRQIIHTVDRIGQAKTGSAAQAIQALNPHVQLRLHQQRLDQHNVLGIFADYDLIVDGTDNFATRYLVNDACVLLNKPYVWGSIFRFEGQASVFWEAAPDGLGRNYRDLYPVPPPPEFAPSCAEGGVLGVLCAAIASVMATETIKLLTGTGTSLLGRLLVYDALDMNYRCLPLQRDPQRQAITALIDYPAFCGAQPPAVDIAEQIEIPAQDLQQLLQSGRDIRLIDVREPNEWQICQIPGAELLPKQAVLSGALSITDEQQAIVVYCKGGLRSAQVVNYLQQRGVRDVRNLKGGILAWIKEVDPSLISY